MMMNAFIVSFYIIVGTFNSLVTFIGISIEMSKTNMKDD